MTVKFLEKYPAYVQRAFGMFYYGYQGQHEDAMRAFAERWGGFGVDTLTRALQNAQGEEKIIAILALGYSGVPQAQAQLLPLLQSTEPMERWASALCLGEVKEEQALPVLIAMLDECLPPELDPWSAEGGHYNYWRITVASLLGEWGRSELAPVLRCALEKAWNLEQQMQDPARKSVLHPYQDELFYALGQLGAFGALTGLQLPTDRLQLGVVLLACGALGTHSDLLTQLQDNQQLKGNVAQVLETKFGLSSEEQAGAIEQYADEYFARMV